MDDLLEAIIVNKILTDDAKENHGSQADMTDGEIAFGRFLIKLSIVLFCISAVLSCVTLIFAAFR